MDPIQTQTFFIDEGRLPMIGATLTTWQASMRRLATGRGLVYTQTREDEFTLTGTAAALESLNGVLSQTASRWVCTVD